MASTEFPLHLLQSAEQVQLLNDIDKLRSDGVQYHDISLPQLVVCGDQSSGKSSVLEALSNVKFPIDKGTCTRFAMELALRRSPDRKTTAKIIPGKKASADRQQRLAEFQPSGVDLTGVPQLIEKARGAMDLIEDHAICDDVLRLEITGPDLPHLTLVDLPGLIADAQDTKDIELVENMVKRYMKNPRSIILAIVSANNDKQNQKVLRLAREFDPRGDRTVGIITKPDTLKNYRGSVAERTYLNMAKNQDPVSKLRLGWHVVRNPDYHEKGPTFNVGEMEKEIFSHEPWNELSKWQLGIGSLRDELTKHLFNQICSELPRVVKDIEREETKCEQELKDLGEVRATPGEQRKYLIGISGRFGQLVRAGLEGHWISDPIFSVESMRLRAQIRNLNDAFEQTMTTKGHAFEFFPASHYRARETLFTGFGNDPVLASQAHLLLKADKILKRGRGQELPGMFDPIRVSEVFKDQSQNWQDLAHQHVEKAWRITNQFLQDLLFKIAPARTSTAQAILNGIVSNEMLHRKKVLDAKIAELLLPYVNNVPVCTPLRMAASLQRIDLEETNIAQHNTSVPQLSATLDSEVDVDACSMLLRYSQAYYNIARDTFVDNVITLGIENCLLAGLAGIFSSDMVLDMGDSQLSNLAGESEKMLSDRKYAEEKSSLLKKSLETCRMHMYKRPIFREDSQRGLAEELAGFSSSSDATPLGAGLFGASVQTDNWATEPHKSPFDGQPGDAALLSSWGIPASSSGTNILGGTTVFTSEASTAPSSTAAFISVPTSSASLPGNSVSVSSPIPSTGSSGAQRSTNKPSSSTSSFGNSASVGSPIPSTGSFGAQRSTNAPPSSTHSASVSSPIPSTGSFGAQLSTNTPPSSATSFAFGTQRLTNPPIPSTGVFGAQRSTNTPIPSIGVFGAQRSTNTPTPSTGVFGAQRSTDTPIPSPGVFGAHRSTNTPTPSTGVFGAQHSTDTPIPSTGVFGAQRSTNTPIPSTGVFGAQHSTNTPIPSTGVFGAQRSTDTPIPSTGVFGAQRSTNTPPSSTRSFGFGAHVSTNTTPSSTSLFGNTASVSSPIPTMSLFGVKPSTNTPHSDTSSDTSSEPRLTAEIKTNNGHAGPSQDMRELDEDEIRVMVICKNLSREYGARKDKEFNGNWVLYQCVADALRDGMAQKSFEELRLEDRTKLEDSGIKRLIHKRNPHLTGRTPTPLEIENWCREFMSNPFAEKRVPECLTQ